jgi:hypothetical protein
MDGKTSLQVTADSEQRKTREDMMENKVYK